MRCEPASREIPATSHTPLRAGRGVLDLDAGLLDLVADRVGAGPLLGIARTSALLEKAGEVADIRTQVPFRIEVNGQLVCKYVADFTYRERAMLVVEDAKGYRTPIYRLKAKLMLAANGIKIREV